MTQATNDISSRVRLARRVDDVAYRFTEAWDVYQDDQDIGFVYLSKGSVIWGWKAFEVSNNGLIGGFGHTRKDATDALIRYIASP